MKKKTEIKRGAIYLEADMTLAEVLQRLSEAGVTDFNKVKFDRDYVGCQCDHGDSYCYCPSSYTDMRFDWET